VCALLDHALNESLVDSWLHRLTGDGRGKSNNERFTLGVTANRRNALWALVKPAKSPRAAFTGLLRNQGSSKNSGFKFKKIRDFNNKHESTDVIELTELALARA
jgi:hypothetical protein